MIENVDFIEVEANIYPNEIDPTVPEYVKDITLEDIEKWNNAKTEVTADDVTFEDGSTFQEKYDNGELKGEKGDTGEQGIQGIQGEKGDKGDKGDAGINGTNGINGKDGADGKTPVKGVDYFTEADKQELVDLVLTEIPSAEGVGY